MSIRPVDDFFSTDDFATAAAYVTVAGVKKVVNVIFDEAFSQVNIGQDEFESTRPMVHVKTDDFPSLRDGDKLTVNGVIYYIIQKEYDVLGISRLLLSLDPV